MVTGEQAGSVLRSSDGAWDVGSEWHRWDPHVHVPGTLFEDGYSGDWDAFAAAVNSALPRVRAVGVTDYATLRSYVEFDRRLKQGAFPGIELAFPNVELRLTTNTSKGAGVNIHLLFSPGDEDHLRLTRRALARLTTTFNGTNYSLDDDSLRDLGRAFDPRQTDPEGALRVGARQFRVDLSALSKWRTDQWLRRNCLVAVSGAADGTSGLKDDRDFMLHRIEIQRLADIIFTSRPADAAFWRSEAASRDGADDGPKPCLHGSDAHKVENVFAPTGDRRCWIKGAFTFETLWHGVLDPGERVCVAPDPPAGPSRSECVTALDVQGAPWMAQTRLVLNPGLVAIIGPKGSGKTALADLIARGADAAEMEDNAASFLHKAAKHLGAASVSVTWGDEPGPTRPLASARRSDALEDRPVPRVRYLSQQFVERLCSGDALGQELVAEIESVVFGTLEESERLNAGTFTELRSARLVGIHQERQEFEEEVRLACAHLDTERAHREHLEARVQRVETLTKAKAAADKERALLVTAGKDDRIKRLAALEAIKLAQERRVASLRSREQLLATLMAEVERERRRTTSLADEWRERYAELSVPSIALGALGGWPSEGIDAELRNAGFQVKQAIDNECWGAGGANAPSEGSLDDTRRKVKAAREELGVDQNREKQYAGITAKIVELDRNIELATRDVAVSRGAPERERLLRLRRREAYAAIVGCLEREASVLESLYAPLRETLKGEADVLRKLEFHVRRRVDLQGWALAGENLVNLARKGPLRGKGAIAELASQYLVTAWSEGDPEAVTTAMDAFVAAADLRRPPEFLAQGVRLGQFVEWLHSTAHISVEYGLRYDGTDLRFLSPGSRGIVLLLLYLAVDTWDTRPIIADQPEENLDPQSVFDDLVEYFKKARRRRQVIIVTHNANLVVNTDADQVIIASAARSTGRLPTFDYTSGPLESARIRERVCQILEGGERAFQQRERRYGLKRA